MAKNICLKMITKMLTTQMDTPKMRQIRQLTRGRIRLRINLRTRTVRIIPKTVARILLMKTGTAVSQDKVQTAEKRHMIK